MLNLPHFDGKTKQLSQVPPWFKMSEYIIDTLTIELYNDESFSQYLDNHYKDFEIIYTDGSKILQPAESVGAAMYLPERSKINTWKLIPQHTVVASELFAIKKALEWTASNSLSDKYTIIFRPTDSLTSLQIMSSQRNTYFETVECIKILLKSLNESNIVILHWIKGHSPQSLSATP